MSQFLEHRHGAYLISDDPARLQVAAIHAYLSQSYWAENIPPDVVERAVRHSLCIGAYDDAGAQVGLARFVSDFATFCYVCDVYVLAEHRRHGLARAMMQLALRHPKLQGLRRWNLVTKDAHALYAKYGFKPVAHPDTYMELRFPDVYRRYAGGDDE